MHRSIFAVSLGGAKESEESRLSIISTQEQTEGKYEADGGQEWEKGKTQPVLTRVNQERRAAISKALTSCCGSFKRKNT